MSLTLVQDSFELVREVSVDNKLSIKGFASTSTIDRSKEIVSDPREFDVITFKNSPQLLLDHDYIKTPEGNKVSAGLVTKAIPAYIKSEDIDKNNWVVHSLCSDEFVSTWPKEKSVDLKVGSKGLFIVAEVTQPHAIELVEKGELGAFSWRGFAAHEKQGELTVLKSIDLVEISIVHTQCERNSTFMLIDEEDPTHNIPVEFTDCQLSSMKFDKDSYSIDQINQYTKQFQIDKYILSESDDSYFLKVGEGLVDSAKSFTFCKTDGISVIAAPMKKKSILEMPLIKPNLMEKDMENVEENVQKDVQNLLLVDLEQFQKLEGVEIKTLGEKEVDGDPVVIHAAYVSETQELENSEEELNQEPTAEADESEEDENADETKLESTETESSEEEVQVQSQDEALSQVGEVLEQVLVAVKGLDSRIQTIEKSQVELDDKISKSKSEIENSVSQKLKQYATKESNEKTLDKLKGAFDAFGRQLPQTPERKETVETKQENQKSLDQEVEVDEKAHNAFNSILGGGLFNQKRGS